MMAASLQPYSTNIVTLHADAMLIITAIKRALSLYYSWSIINPARVSGVLRLILHCYKRYQYNRHFLIVVAIYAIKCIENVRNLQKFV